MRFAVVSLQDYPLCEDKENKGAHRRYHTVHFKACNHFAWSFLGKMNHKGSPFAFTIILQLLSTSFDLQVRWDGQRSGQIIMPVEYFDNTCGLCGTFDGNPDNDFYTRDGMLVSLTSLPTFIDIALVFFRHLI